MSQINNVISQIKKLTGIFGERVAGAAEFEAAKDQGFMPSPAAYVIPIGFDATENQSSQHLYQIVTERIGVIVQFSNAAGVLAGERRGQSVAEQFETVQFGLFKALLSWNPMNLIENPDLFDPTDPTIGHGIKGFYLIGGQILSYDLSRLYFQWTFGIDVTITEKDGWEVEGVPLDRIGLSIIDATEGDVPPGDVLLTAEIDLPQPPARGVEARAEVGKLRCVIT